MAVQLQKSDCERLLNSLIKEMGYPVNVGGRTALAFCADPLDTAPMMLSLAETAPAAELLIHPEAWSNHAGAASRAIDFLMSLSEGDELKRGWLAAGFEIVRDDPRDFRILTALYEFSGDLSRGELRQAPRHGGRPGVLHSGNMLEFRWSGRHCLDVEEAVMDFGILRDGGLMHFFHESRFTAKVGLLLKREREIGRLRYDYTISRDSPTMKVSVTFTPAQGARLDQLRLTTAIDDASGDAELPSNTFLVDRGAGPETRPAPMEGSVVSLHAGPAKLFTVTGDGKDGVPLSLLCRPAEPALLVSVKATMRHPGHLHWLVNRYEPQPSTDGAYRVSEDRLMLVAEGQAGLTAETMPAATHDRVQGRFALGEHHATGEALAAVAMHVLLAQREAYQPPVPSGRDAQLFDWFNRHVEGWFARARLRAPAVRDLGFILPALDATLRATGYGHYAKRLEEGLAMLLDCQAEDGLFANEGGRSTLDGHAAALFSLARLSLAPLPKPLAGRLRTALARGLGAIRLGSVEVSREGQRQSVDTPLIRRPDGTEDGALLTEKAALLMRALRMVEVAAGNGGLSLEAAEEERLSTLTNLTLALLRRRMRLGPEGIEVSASATQRRVTPQSQAMTILALLDPPAESLAPYPAMVN
ncbi:hypothetical protein IAI18_04755 [Acetobacteraceae bacterium H6797]|nr:hypothetical protein [Acetobacteraceae bacterium H6797]